MRILYLLTIFISSFLLFLVQPMLAKAILPLVGGAPAVWVVTMLFFQLLLLAGYGYAALTSAKLSARHQAWAHLALYAIALATMLPLTLHTPTKAAADSPEIWVMTTLLLSIGLPYFILSAHSSLLQRWYHHAFKQEPYHLFSASNLGSLLGLFGYPFAVEWLLPLSAQMHYWGCGFLLVAGLLAVLGYKLPRGSAAPTEQGEARSGGRSEATGACPHALKVAFAGFIPSSLFLGVTLYITTDVASLPMLWILPLALYLLSFILVFSRFGEAITAAVQKIHPLAILVVFLGAAPIALPLSLLAFFIIALSCHGQAMRLKPPAESLTSYYFWLSLGGALGGLFNTLAPHVFNDVYEYPLIMILSILVLPAKFKLDGKRSLPPKQMAALAGMMVVCIGIIFFSGQKTPVSKSDKVVYQSRNFFGVSKVMNFADHREYMHGTTTHGIQAKDEAHRLNPVSYYGPIKRLIESLPAEFFAHPFGVLGLGAGTTACYGHKGQAQDFYEIDQAVIDIAQNPEFFTYLRDCPPKVSIIKGDGRLELAKQPAARYSLLVLDAFTSDAVPLHLLTHDAIKMYIGKTVPEIGVIAFDVSNRHLNLAPLIARAAKEEGWLSFQQVFIADKTRPYEFTSEWIVLVPPSSPWIEQLMLTGLKPLSPPDTTPLWTDDYSNILPAMKWRLESLW